MHRLGVARRVMNSLYMNFDTEYPADSVEFCPHEEFQDILVCGTYKLIEEKGTPSDHNSEMTEVQLRTPRRRLGKCLVLKVSAGEDGTAVDVLDALELPAVLDMKWSFSKPDKGALLGIADSEGHISLLHWDGKMQKVQTVQCRSPETLCLSLDWSNRRTLSEHSSVIVSCSDGYLSLLQQRDDGLLYESSSWHSHEYEPWIAAWNYWNTNIVYSGGDDLMLKGWDIRQNNHSPIFTNKRFDAGVTSIQSHPHLENIIAVGSYDASIRVFDIRMPVSPIIAAEVGGGAWRVKWHPAKERSMDLLVACMHDGFKVLSFPSSAFGGNRPHPTHNMDTVDIKRRFDEHTSLAYGVDWSYATGNSKTDTLIASCSFYDHSLRLWRC